MKRPQHRPDPNRRFPLAHGVATTTLAVLGCLSIAGCTAPEIPGTYDVELLIEGAQAPIEATLILTTSYLETGHRDYDRPGGDEALGDPNSCLILPSASARANTHGPAPGSLRDGTENDKSDEIHESAPRSVTFFESRIRGEEFLVPVTVFETSGERMEITKLSFFAGAVGGELSLTGEDGQRAGRIVGDRVAGPDAARCHEALAAFYARIDRLIQEAERKTVE